MYKLAYLIFDLQLKLILTYKQDARWARLTFILLITSIVFLSAVLPCLGEGRDV